MCILPFSGYLRITQRQAQVSQCLNSPLNTQVPSNQAVCLQVARSPLPSPFPIPDTISAICFYLLPSLKSLTFLTHKVGSQLPAVRHTLLLSLCCVWVPSELRHLTSNLFLLGFGTCRPLILSYAFVRSLCLSHCFLPGLLYVCSSYQLPGDGIHERTMRSWSHVSHLEGNGSPHQVTPPSQTQGVSHRVLRCLAVESRRAAFQFSKKNTCIYRCDQY